MIKAFTGQIKRVFPLANYGYARAVSGGQFKYGHGALGIYNKLSLPAGFYDCSSSTRAIVRAARGAGLKADACLMLIPTEENGKNTVITQHLVTVVRDEAGRPTHAIGLTPYDQLLGIYPFTAIDPGNEIGRLLTTTGQLDNDDLIFDRALNAAGVILRINRPAPGLGFSTEVDLLALSARRWFGLFGITSFGLSYSATKRNFLLQYGTDFYGKGNSAAAPLSLRARRTIEFRLPADGLEALRGLAAEPSFAFERFSRWLRANEHRFASFTDDLSGADGHPFRKRAITGMLAANWATVATFLNKLPDEVLEQ